MREAARRLVVERPWFFRNASTSSWLSFGTVPAMMSFVVTLVRLGGSFSCGIMSAAERSLIAGLAATSAGLRSSSHFFPRTTQTPTATRPRTTAICATRRRGIGMED